MNPQLHADQPDYSKLPVQWARLIIDGDSGSGKTTLANRMAGVLRATVVSLDEHLLENGNLYCNQINYEPLRSAICAGGPRVIIEGVCILKVLAKIDITYDYHIFMKLYNGMLGWEYEQYLPKGARLPRSKLTREIAEYYREYKPFDKCNELLERNL